MWGCLWRSIDIENDRRAGFCIPFPLGGHTTRQQWRNLTRTANGYSQKVQLETGGNKAPIPEEVLAAARATWPHIVIHATREFERQGSTREAVALAADIWEAVLRSVARAFQRKGEYASSIGDLESYLLTAFRHRFHRFLKAEEERHEVFQPVSGPLNLDLLETTQNAQSVSELERKIALR